jgi:hypothetical protein
VVVEPGRRVSRVILRPAAERAVTLEEPHAGEDLDDRPDLAPEP